MRHYRYLLLLLVGISFLWDCNNPQSSKNGAKDLPQEPKDNYIVLLDLGDRILADNQQQVPKDIEVIKSIYGIFKAKLNSKDPTKQYYAFNDKIKLLGAPNWFYASVDLAGEQPDNRAMMPDKMEKTFNALLPEIYKGVLAGKNDSTYAGADIWKYFNEHLANDLDKDGKNTLFIVTDGYMSIKKTEEHATKANRFASCTQIIDSLRFYPDWETRFTKNDYGLLPVEKKFSNLRVIVLQLNPREGWKDEYSLLTKIWDKWFTEMGISNYTLIKQDSISTIKASLAKLMNTKIDSAARPEQWAKIATTDSALTTIPATEKKASDALNKNAATATKEIPVTAKEVVVPVPQPVPSTSTTAGMQKPVLLKKKTTSTTPEVLPPDESDASLLPVKQSTRAAAKKAASKNNDDILQDAGAANGFNTGIKKDTKKKNQ